MRSKKLPTKRNAGKEIMLAGSAKLVKADLVYKQQQVAEKLVTCCCV